MKTTAYLMLSGSLLAMAAAISSPAYGQATSWTGGSSGYTDAPATGAGGGVAFFGDNLWHNAANWSSGLPGVPVDVSIGLATMDHWYTRYACAGPGGIGDVDWCQAEFNGLRPGGGWDTVLLTGAAGNARNLYIGLTGGRGIEENAGGPGRLVNQSGLTVGQDMTVGHTGAGIYEATGGNTTVVGNLIIGGQAIGTATNDSTINVTRDITVGGDEQGTLTNTGTVIAGEDITIGRNGQGTVVNSGTMQSGENFVVGGGAQGDLTNNGGTITVGRNFTVGDAAQGTVTSNDGTISVAGNTSIGELAGSIGIVDLNGSATMTTGGTMMVGEHGTGTLNIAPDATAETFGRVSLGTSVSGNGTVINEGTMINHQEMLVGGAGRGYLHTARGATTTTTGDVTVGESATSVGFVSVKGRMDNAERFDIGVHGEGYLVVDDGGWVKNRESVLGKEPGGKGYALVTGATSLWDNTYSLTLGSENNTTGVLIINNDGEVRIREGYGVLTIAEMAGSTGILNIGGMLPSPFSPPYGIDQAVLNYIGTLPASPPAATPTLNGNSGAPLAAGTLDAAFVQFGEGTGTVNFNHIETEANEYRFKAGFIGNGQIDHYAGFTVLDGDSSAFTGDSHVLGGIMVVNNVLGGGMLIDPQGTLRIGHRDGLTGDVMGDIVNNGLLQFYRADTYEYDSVISGTGAVEQMGTGTTVLTGENTYTGPTRILRGTLQLGDGGTTGSIDSTSGVAISPDGTLAFNRSDIKVFDRTITGTGTVAQIGTGLTRLTADNSGFTGQARIDAGTLSVNNLFGGTVDVNDTGTLEGLGQVKDTTVHAGGTIAPGNSTEPNMQKIGKFTVDGDLVQEAGSFHKTEVLSTGNNPVPESDLLYVTGAAIISPESTLHVTKLDPARYELEHRYTVLTANGGVTGDYILTGDTFVSTFYRIEDHYDPNNVYLKVAQHRLFQEAGRTPNQIAAATAAQELKAARDSRDYPTNPLFRAIAYLPTDQDARYAFDQISGEIYASAQGAMVEESHFVRDAMGDRLRAAFGDNEERIVGYIPGVDLKDPTPQPVYSDQEGVVLWARGLGGWGWINGDGNAAELKRNGGGILVGADAPVKDNFRIGILAGYDRTEYDVRDRHSKATSDNYHLGLYGGAEWRNLALQLGGSYTWHQAEVERHIVFGDFAEHASSEYDAATAQVYGDLNYTFHLDELRIQPFLGLAYVGNEQDGYDEKGGYAALHGGEDQSLEGTYGSLGLRVSRVFQAYEMDWTLHGMGAWRRAFKNVNPTATHHFDGSSLFTVFGTSPDKDAGVVQIGLDANLSERWDMGMSYAGQYSDDIEFHNLRADLNYKF